MLITMLQVQFFGDMTYLPLPVLNDDEYQEENKYQQRQCADDKYDGYLSGFQFFSF